MDNNDEGLLTSNEPNQPEEEQDVETLKKEIHRLKKLVEYQQSGLDYCVASSIQSDRENDIVVAVISMLFALLLFLSIIGAFFTFSFINYMGLWEVFNKYVYYII